MELIVRQMFWSIGFNLVNSWYCTVVTSHSTHYRSFWYCTLPKDNTESECSQYCSWNDRINQKTYSTQEAQEWRVWQASKFIYVLKLCSQA